MADTIADLKKMKVPELKQALKEKGLPVSGSKAELIKRLGEALGATIDTSNDGLEESLQGIDDILNDEAVPVSSKKTSDSKAAPVTPAKPAAKDVKPTLTTQKSETVSSNGVSEKTDASKKTTADTTVEEKSAQISKLSDAERLKIRAEKFGAVSLDAKKELRAQRFGLAASGDDVSSTKNATNEFDRLKKRAERFGSVVSTSLSKVDEEERKRKRAERFGSVSNTSSSSPSVRKIPGASSTTDQDNEAKKRKRAERFGPAT